MANYPIYRIVKDSELTFAEMDGNLEWLSKNLSGSSVTISGSTVLYGDLTVTNGISGYLYGTSSWAVSSSYTISSSYAQSSSYTTTSSYSVNAISASYVSGSTGILGDLTASRILVNDTIVAKTIVSQVITSSTEWITGSSKFGSLSTDTHQFTGSLLAQSITGSLLGTSSLAVTASYALNGGVTKIVAGTNVTISPTNGLGDVTINSAAGITLNGSGYVSMSGATVAYVSAIPNKDLANSSITIQGSSTALGGSVNVINGTGFVKATGTSISYDNSVYYSASNPNGYTTNTGTVTSVTVSAGSGLSGGGTVTSTGTITLTNSAPDQTVVLSSGTGISATGTYPNFTITNTSPDQTVSLTSGTGISVTGTYPNFTISSTGTGANIYNSDGTLSANRTVTGGSNSLTFSGTNGFIVTGSTTNEVMKLSSAEPYLLIQADGATNAASIFLKPSTSAQNGTIQNRSGGGLEFYTGGTPSLAMTIGSNLNLGIGAVANISNSLEIGRANQWSAAFIGNLNGSRTPSQNYGLHFGWNYTGGSGESNIIWGTGTGGNPYLTFSSWNGTSKVDRLEIQDNGRIVFKNYTTTTSFTGTVVGFLGFDASGNILTTTGSGATGGASLSGGKTNYNTIWNSTTTVSTGSVYQYSANQVVITGSSLAVGDIAPSATPGRIDATNDVVAYSTSDIRFKENIKPINNAVSKVNQISGVEFDWIEDIDHHGNKGHDIGVIAQELEQVLPEVVTTRDSGYKAVKYDKIVALLIQAVKEQQSEIIELKSRIDGLTK